MSLEVDRLRSVGGMSTTTIASPVRPSAGVQRVPLEVQRTGRAFGRGLLVVVALAAAGLGAAAWRLEMPRGLTVGLFLQLALLAAIATWLLRRSRDELEIDLARRTVVVVRERQRSAERPLESLAPLAVVRRSRTVHSSGEEGHRQSRVVVDYAVRVQGPGDCDLRAFRSAAKARREMERLARAWGLPSRSLGGEDRLPAELDLPLVQRLRGRLAAAPSAAPELARRGVEVAARGGAYVVRSSYRDRHEVVWAVVTLVAIAGMTAWTAPIARDLIGQGGYHGRWAMAPFLAIGAALLLGALRQLAKLRDVYAPGELRLDAGGARYRDRRLALDRIEEVLAGERLELAGDRRALRLPPTFCPPQALEPLAREVERCLVEVSRTGVVERR